jgi:hypothetical protein
MLFKKIKKLPTNSPCIIKEIFKESIKHKDSVYFILLGGEYYDSPQK